MVVIRIDDDIIKTAENVEAGQELGGDERDVWQRADSSRLRLNRTHPDCLHSPFAQSSFGSLQGAPAEVLQVHLLEPHAHHEGPAHIKQRNAQLLNIYQTIKQICSS